MAIHRARQITTVATFTLIAGLTLSLAGCKRSSSADTATGSTPTAGSTTPAPATTVPGTTAPATAPAPAPTQGKLTGPPTACPSADDVISNLKLSALVLGSGDPSLCVYDFHGNKQAPYVEITFNAAPGFTPAMLQAGLAGGQKDVKPVSGVADAAFSFTPKEGPGVGLTFLSGTIVCSIVTTVPTTPAGEIALATVILGG